MQYNKEQRTTNSRAGVWHEDAEGQTRFVVAHDAQETRHVLHMRQHILAEISTRCATACSTTARSIPENAHIGAARRVDVRRKASPLGVIGPYGVGVKRFATGRCGHRPLRAGCIALRDGPMWSSDPTGRIHSAARRSMWPLTPTGGCKALRDGSMWSSTPTGGCKRCATVDVRREASPLGVILRDSSSSTPAGRGKDI